MLITSKQLAHHSFTGQNSYRHFRFRKTYDRIESQFLKAKLELHQSLEKKEMLTEHLCTIISHNEERKAKKLSDLMEKVGISPELPLPSSTTNRCSNGTTTEDNGNQ